MIRRRVSAIVILATIVGCRPTEIESTAITTAPTSEPVAQAKTSVETNEDHAPTCPEGYPLEILVTEVAKMVAPLKMFGTGDGGGLWEGKHCAMHSNVYQDVKTPWLPERALFVEASYAWMDDGHLLAEVVLNNQLYRRDHRDQKELKWCGLNDTPE